MGSDTQAGRQAGYLSPATLGCCEWADVLPVQLGFALGVVCKQVLTVGTQRHTQPQPTLITLLTPSITTTSTSTFPGLTVRLCVGLSITTITKVLPPTVVVIGLSPSPLRVWRRPAILQLDLREPQVPQQIEPIVVPVGDAVVPPTTTATAAAIAIASQRPHTHCRHITPCGPGGGERVEERGGGRWVRLKRGRDVFEASGVWAAEGGAALGGLLGGLLGVLAECVCHEVVDEMLHKDGQGLVLPYDQHAQVRVVPVGGHHLLIQITRHLWLFESMKWPDGYAQSGGDWDCRVVGPLRGKER
mmetsp:Transcript_1452/g.3160  ORF Transcript_1452/g.3160 Transcript_1452/m.3160 type:complete len:302 (+) Transcript_1452:385-1290(+)